MKQDALQAGHLRPREGGGEGLWPPLQPGFWGQGSQPQNGGLEQAVKLCGDEAKPWVLRKREERGVSYPRVKAL